MTLHLPTVLFLTTLVSVLLGGMQLAVWSQRPRIPALLWWGMGFLLGGVGVLGMALRPMLPEQAVIQWMNALIMLGFSLIWAGTRSFSGRTSLWPAALTGPLVWLAACQIPAFNAHLPLRVAIFSALVGSITLMAARELARPVNRGLFLSRLASGILYTHGVLLLVRVPSAFLLDYSMDFSHAPLWMTLFAIEPVLFTIAIGLCLIALVKEKSEVRQRHIASLDLLTSIANRRGFLDHAEDLAASLQHTASCGAMLLFDLDHFKRINDTFGHGAGDRVLKQFARVASANLRRSDALGRIGGEEFAAFLPGADVGGARRNAERIRRLFREAIALSEDRASEATVSVGIAVAAGPGVSIDRLIARADRALYQAKADGRDRVVIDRGDDRAGDTPPSPGPSGLLGAPGPDALTEFSPGPLLPRPG